MATHSIVGANVAVILQANPALAGVAALVSHFVLDAIPHWDYQLKSSSSVTAEKVRGVHLLYGRALFFDLMKVGFDLALGLLIIGLLFYPAGWSVLTLAYIGAGLAILPDVVQVIFGKWRHSALIYVQKLHDFCHADLRLAGRPMIGISTQVLVVVVVIFLSRLF